MFKDVELYPEYFIDVTDIMPWSITSYINISAKFIFLLGYLKVSKLKGSKREHAFQNASQII